MPYPDLKDLIWGRHLQRLLAACGVSPHPHEPAPRVVGKVPPWFQRLGVILTLLGLVGGIRMVDRAISPKPTHEVREAEVVALDASAWNQWINQSWPLHLSPRTNPADPSSATEPITVSLENPEAAPSQNGETAAAIPGNKHAGTSPHRFQRVEITAYSSRSSETDPTPALTATSTRAAAGTIALSRDLIRTFTPGAPFEFGDKVLIPGVGIFEVRDTMNPRWEEKADIWLDSPDKARQWGCRTVFVTRLDVSTRTVSPSIH